MFSSCMELNTHIPRPVFFQLFKAKYFTSEEGIEIKLMPIIFHKTVVYYNLKFSIRGIFEYYGTLFFEDQKLFTIPSLSNKSLLLCELNEESNKLWPISYYDQVENCSKHTQIILEKKIQSNKYLEPVYKFRFKKFYPPIPDSDIVFYFNKINGVIGLYIGLLEAIKDEQHETIIHLQGDILINDDDFSNKKFGGRFL